MHVTVPLQGPRCDLARALFQAPYAARSSVLEEFGRVGGDFATVVAAGTGGTGMEARRVGLQ